MSTKALRKLVDYALEAWDGEGPDAEAARDELAAIQEAARTLATRGATKAEEIRAATLLSRIAEEAP